MKKMNSQEVTTQPYEQTHRNSIGVFLANLLSFCPSLFKRMLFLIFPLHWCTFKSSEYFVGYYQTRKTSPSFQSTSKMALNPMFPRRSRDVMLSQFPPMTYAYLVYFEKNSSETNRKLLSITPHHNYIVPDTN